MAISWILTCCGGDCSGSLTVADQILQKVKEGDTEAASELIVAAVESGDVNSVTEAAVNARDEDVGQQMIEALMKAVEKGVPSDDVAEAFTVLGYNR